MISWKEKKFEAVVATSNRVRRKKRRKGKLGGQKCSREIILENATNYAKREKEFKRHHLIHGRKKSGYHHDIRVG